MDTGAPIPMATDLAGILTLTQWFSPAYPVGSFSYSHGLEWAIDAGDVTDCTSLKSWIVDVLEHGAGRSDAVFLAAAFKSQALDELAKIDATCRAFAASKERLLETDQQGSAFVKVTSAIWEADPSNLCFPVAAGRAARLCDLPLEITVAIFVQGFASNLVTVGMRLVPIGQTEGQRLIKTLNPICLNVARAALDGDLQSLSSTAFLADIAAMRHETQYSRIFRT